jgi:hypothetical protein
MLLLLATMSEKDCNVTLGVTWGIVVVLYWIWAPLGKVAALLGVVMSLGILIICSQTGAGQ